MQRCKLEQARKKLIQAQEKLIKNTQENNNDFIMGMKDEEKISIKNTPKRFINNNNIKVSKIYLDNDEKKKISLS